LIRILIGLTAFPAIGTIRGDFMVMSYDFVIDNLDDGKERKFSKTYISLVRFQKAFGNYFQFITVFREVAENSEGAKYELYYSEKYYKIRNYVDGLTGSKYLECPLMISKLSPKYKLFEKKYKPKQPESSAKL